MALIERAGETTVASALAIRATTDPGRAFVYQDGRPFSLGELDSQAEALAAALANLGLEEKDRVALLLPRPWALGPDPRGWRLHPRPQGRPGSAPEGTGEHSR